MLKLIRVYQLFLRFLVIAFVILSVSATECKGFCSTLLLSFIHWNHFDLFVSCFVVVWDLLFGSDCFRQLDFIVWIKFVYLRDRICVSFLDLGFENLGISCLWWSEGTFVGLVISLTIKMEKNDKTFFLLLIHFSYLFFIHYCISSFYSYHFAPRNLFLVLRLSEVFQSTKLFGVVFFELSLRFDWRGGKKDEWERRSFGFV